MYWRICLGISMLVGGLFTSYLIRDALSGPNYQSALAEGWPMPANWFVAVTIFFALLGGLGIVFLGTLFGAWVGRARDAAKGRRSTNEAIVRRAKMESV